MSELLRKQFEISLFFRNSLYKLKRVPIRDKSSTKSIMKFKYLVQLLTIFMVFYLGPAKLVLADTPQTHDVPMFHNDDGLGLLQDCRFMRAIAVGQIKEIPATVNARSTNCLASIKSVVQVVYSVQKSIRMPTICIPSVELDWLEVLEYVTTFMKNQPPETLANESYGVWIMHAIREKYPCK